MLLLKVVKVAPDGQCGDAKVLGEIGHTHLSFTLKERKVLFLHLI